MIKNIIHKIAIYIYNMTTIGLKKGPHITRYFMYQHLSKYYEPRPSDLKVLSISGSNYLGKLLGFQDHQITEVSYPEVTIFDLPFKDGEFDCIVSDQVLEHVDGYPQLAIEETLRVLKPNGIALHTTCFINPIHGAPSDYWRFTPEGLRLLTSKHGDVIDVGGWGNPYALVYMSLGLRTRPIPHASWHPAHWIANHNHPNWPICTWVMIRKKLTN